MESSLHGRTFVALAQKSEVEQVEYCRESGVRSSDCWPAFLHKSLLCLLLGVFQILQQRRSSQSPFTAHQVNGAFVLLLFFCDIKTEHVPEIHHFRVCPPRRIDRNLLLASRIQCEFFQCHSRRPSHQASLHTIL